MGNLLGGQEEPPYDDTTDSEDDLPKEVYMKQRIGGNSAMIQCDASMSAGNNLNIIAYNLENYTLTQDLLYKIESKLDECEKVSLCYLLFDGPEALRQMKRVLNEQDATIVCDFFEKNKSIADKSKFVEALCVIQNYAILKDLGYLDKKELKRRFNPDVQGVTTYLNKFKKYIYKLFDNMDNEKYHKFFDLVKDDFTTFKKFKYFEMSFAHFEKSDYINESRLQNLLKHLKVLELDSEYDFLSKMQSGQYEINQSSLLCNLKLYDDESLESTNMIADKAADLNLPSTSRHQFKPVMVTQSYSNEFHERYEINPNSPGVFLLIENKTFYSEFDKTLQDRVLQKQIEERKGTEFDSERMLKFFKKYGYKCIHKKNLTHTETIEAIQETVDNMTGEETSFYTCFLSHGERAKIIACNNIAVSVEDIKQTMISPKLKGKPKILILQSCQGDVIQSVPVINHGLTTDGASNTVDPDTADFIEIYSTVPGFASIRNIFEGTWFIQSLCDVLEQNPNENLTDICIKTNYAVGQKEWIDQEKGVKYKMTCMNTNTLRKKLYLLP